MGTSLSQLAAQLNAANPPPIVNPIFTGPAPQPQPLIFYPPAPAPTQTGIANPPLPGQSPPSGTMQPPTPTTLPPDPATQPIVSRPTAPPGRSEERRVGKEC